METWFWKYPLKYLLFSKKFIIAVDKNKIQNIIIGCLKEYLESQDIEIELNGSTPLFSSESVLDSMGLVNIIIDIESRLLDEDLEVTLASEEAMSRTKSPFRTISTLTDFVYKKLEEKNDE